MLLPSHDVFCGKGKTRGNTGLRYPVEGISTRYGFSKWFSVVKALSGFRGGNWNNAAANERVSDRNNAANTNATRNNNNGGRAAKTSLVLDLKTGIER